MDEGAIKSCLSRGCCSVVIDRIQRAFPSDELRERLGEVWTAGLQAYREMDYDHQTVIHNERYVSADGVHVNQAECLSDTIPIRPSRRKIRYRAGEPTTEAFTYVSLSQGIYTPLYNHNAYFG